MTVFVPPPGPSARAQDLGRDIAKFIENYRRQHPGTSDTDVQQALKIAGTFSGGNAQQRIMLAVAIGLLLLGVLGFLYFGAEGDMGEFSPRMPLIVGAIVAFLLVAVVAKRVSR